jgi:hypothetical protein
LGVDPIDALVAFGIEARDSGDLTLAAGVFKEFARYVYPSARPSTQWPPISLN